MCLPGGGLRPIGTAVGVEALFTAAVWALLGVLPVPEAIRAVVAAATGVGLAVLLLNRDPAGPLGEAREAVSKGMARPAAPAA